MTIYYNSDEFYDGNNHSDKDPYRSLLGIYASPNGSVRLDSNFLHEEVYNAQPYIYFNTVATQSRPSLQQYIRENIDSRTLCTFLVPSTHNEKDNVLYPRGIFQPEVWAAKMYFKNNSVQNNYAWKWIKDSSQGGGNFQVDIDNILKTKH